MVVHSVNIRLFLTIIAINNYKYYQFNFNTTFLNAPILNNIKYYIQQPIIPKKPIFGYRKKNIVY